MECTQNQDKIDFSNIIKYTFDEVSDLFRELHINLSHGKPISENEIPLIENSINQYMTIYRENFQGKVLPKHNILEKHCIPWVMRYGFGLALHGEQGGELIHSSVAKLERRGMGFIRKKKKTNEGHHDITAANGVT